jgi:hypothetical protein
MNKLKILIACMLLMLSVSGFAQENEPEDPRKGKFKQENIFLGTASTWVSRTALLILGS